MKTIDTIDDLAEVMFKVYGGSTLSDEDFALCLVSCAISVFARSRGDAGKTDEEVLKLVLNGATSSLAVVRARQTLEGRTSGEVH